MSDATPSSIQAELIRQIHEDVREIRKDNGRIFARLEAHNLRITKIERDAETDNQRETAEEQHDRIKRTDATERRARIFTWFLQGVGTAIAATSAWFAGAFHTRH